MADDLPVVGQSYKARAEKWCVRKDNTDDPMIMIYFKVLIREEKDENGKPKPVVWRRWKQLSFKGGAFPISKEALRVLGHEGDLFDICEGKGNLGKNAVEVTIEKGEDYRRGDKVIPGSLDIGFVNEIGAVRIGKPMSVSDMRAWATRMNEMFRKFDAGDKDPKNDNGSRLPKGAESPGMDFTAMATGTDDDIPF